jgi:hypothetical protein
VPILSHDNLSGVTWRMAIQSLKTMDMLYDEEHFVQALLQCAGPNQIYIGKTTKDQLECMTPTAAYTMMHYKLDALGTFERLGNDVNVDIYRIGFPNGA